MIQILVHDIRNDINFPVSQGGFHDASNENGILCIRDTSPIKYPNI